MSDNAETLMTPLPCPWCGETSGDVVQTSTFRWRAYTCGCCGVVGPEIRVQTMGNGSPDDWEAAGRRDAIKAWNTRAADKPTEGA